MQFTKILLSHGSGGKLTQELISGLLLKKLRNSILEELGDSALINYKEKLAFTTDSFVVSPLFFAGSDIGKLAVCGTVNDLVMAGASPEYLSLAFIIEEGLDYRVLEKIVDSISLSARQAGVHVVTGDTKVVEKGACDKIFINTSGIGRLVSKTQLSIKNIEPGDEVILTGNIAEHGLAVLARRKGFDFGFNIKSDCAALNGLLVPLLKKTRAVRFMRDPTRGGVAAVLNEVAKASGLAVMLDEKDIPVTSKVKAACELLGIDPLFIANEGKAVIIVKKGSGKSVLGLLKKHPLARSARLIGRIARTPGSRVVLNTLLDTARIIDMPLAEALPRIC